MDNLSFHENITIIKKYKDNISYDLEQIEFFEEESYYFMDIWRMFNYISNDIKLYYENLAFIKDTLKGFKDLILKKIEVESKKNMEINYAEEHEKFLEFLDKQKDIFYTRIYEKTGEYDELIVEVTNILG